MRELPDLIVEPRPNRMRLVLFLIAMMVLGVIAWAGWQRIQVETQPNLKGPIKANDLQGTWAWFGPENCKAFFRTISFSGDRIYARNDSLGLIDVDGAKYAMVPGNGQPVVSVTYELGGNTNEARYRFASRAEISLVDDLKNGERNPAIDLGRGRILVRCPERDPMPEIGSVPQPLGDDEPVDGPPQ
jgi:hypothetical protein